MLEDRIIVQDRGMDAGLLSLMQNANKGNMDPAALMAMMNNGGMNGNGSWIWIILLFVLFGFGGNGFGGNRNNAGIPALASELNNDANTSMLLQAINGNGNAIQSLSNTLHCDVNSLQSALSTINAGVSQIGCDVKLSGCEVINAITSGNAALASKLAECCCETQRSIDGVNLSITKMGYENQLANLNQTSTLTGTMTAGFNIINAKIDAQTAIINDKFCQLEMREMQNKIDVLRNENTQLAFAASQQAQTANIINQLRVPAPIPAYTVANPNCCNPCNCPCV